MEDGATRPSYTQTRTATMTYDNKTGGCSKPWRLYRVDPEGHPFGAPVAEADTQAELSKHQRRQDWSYKTYHHNQPVEDRIVPRKP